MTSKKRFVYISNMAAPYQVRFCDHLQQYFETQFWFYEYMGASRPDWWKIELPPSCKVIDHLWFKWKERYVSFRVINMLNEFDPDIVMVGGFLIPSNYLVYRWAKRRKKKVIVFTETFRRRETGQLRGKSIFNRLIELAYGDIDAIFACHEDARQQMVNVFDHFGSITHIAPYSSDIDRYFTHPIRKKKEGYVYIFPNRLTENYNPLLVLGIFAEIASMQPRSILKMNAQGELFNDCRKFISQQKLDKNVQFLTHIKYWDDLSDIYRTSDILLFPAKFSNGNFTIIEAMASGMGIIVSNKILGQTSLIRHGENGFLCEPNKDEFLKAVQEYIAHPQYFESHARINRDLVRSCSGEGTARLYAKLINEKVLSDLHG